MKLIYFGKQKLTRQNWLAMKLTIILMMAAFSQLSAKVISQTVNFSGKDVSLKKVFTVIKNQTGNVFFYDAALLRDAKPVTVALKNATLETALNEIFKNQPFTWVIENKTITIIKKTLSPIMEMVSVEPTPALPPPPPITGKVTDDKGQPLAGATILVKGTGKGTKTDANGSFSIDADPNSTLTISYVGFENTTIKISNQETISVQLKPSIVVSDQVVIIGYGNQSKIKVTGSIASISGKQLENQPVGQLAQKLQGRLAGVQVNQSSGVPGGGGLSFRIRGAASINGGNEPLYVIDGAPIVGGLTTINPDEIDNISILKGPSAAALYGSRAANGVILITTKKGKNGLTTIELDVNNGVAEVPKSQSPDVMDSKEFLNYYKEFYEDKAIYEGYTGGVPDLYKNPESWTGPNTNWLEALTRPAPRQNYSLSISSGTEKINSSNTIGYYNEDGIIINSGYKRFSLRSNNNFKVNQNIKFGVNVSPSYQTGNHDGSITDYRANSTTDGLFSNFYSALVTPSIFSPDDKNPDGTTKLTLTGPGLFVQPNWGTVFRETIELSNKTRLLANAFIDYNFLKAFTFKSAISTDLQNSTFRIFNPTNTGSIFSAPPTQATGIYTTAGYRSWVTENTLNYKKTFSEDHNVDVIAGYSAQKFRQENNRQTGQGFPDNQVTWIDAASTRGAAINFPINANSFNNSTEWSLLSMFGRINYDYKGKYLFSASIRRDGSSRFGSDERWGTFPSISAGWIISDEKFLGNVSWLNFLKLRAEYGSLGNFNIGNYSYLSNISSSNYVFGGALSQGRSATSLGNNSLTWETTKGFDIGVDMSLFKNRINIVADYYDKNTNNMLFQVDIPRGTGFSNIPSNIGEFHFWGAEFSITSQNLVGAFKWETSFNISYNDNRVIALGTNNVPLQGADFDSRIRSNWRTAVGQPMGQWFGYVSDGIYRNKQEFNSQPKAIGSYVGGVRNKDVNGDGVINTKDLTFIGNPNPKYLYGLTNTFSYKGFDLNILLQGVSSNQIYYGLFEWTALTQGIFNVDRGQKGRWRSETNPGNGLYPSTLGGQAAEGFSTRFLDNGAYLAVRNIALGYTFQLKNSKIRKARIYGSIQNPFLFTGYRGMNPEASSNGLNGTSQGADYSPYPIPRITSIGLNISL